MESYSYGMNMNDTCMKSTVFIRVKSTQSGGVLMGNDLFLEIRFSYNTLSTYCMFSLHEDSL